jgi:hypothetical protein
LSGKLDPEQRLANPHFVLYTSGVIQSPIKGVPQGEKRYNRRPTMISASDSRRSRPLNSPLLITAVFTLLLSAASTARADCPPPASHTNIATVLDGSLRVTLASERYEYVLGESISFLLIFENTGASPVTIQNIDMISPFLGTVILPDTCTAIGQPGCFEASPWFAPQVIFFFGTSITLNPGQCTSTTINWNGLHWLGQEVIPGAYKAFGGAFHSDLNVEPFVVHQPAGGVVLPLFIREPGVPAVTTTWGGIKARVE